MRAGADRRETIDDRATARPTPRPGELAEAESNAEFLAYDAELCDAPQPAPGEGAGIAAESRAFRRGCTLDGRKLRDLIAEGHDQKPYRPSPGDQSITVPTP